MAALSLGGCSREETAEVIVTVLYSTPSGQHFPDVEATIQVFEGNGEGLDGSLADWRNGAVMNTRTGEVVESIHTATVGEDGRAIVGPMDYGQYYFSVSSKSKPQHFGNRIQVSQQTVRFQVIFE